MELVRCYFRRVYKRTNIFIGVAIARSCSNDRKHRALATHHVFEVTCE